MVTRRPINIGDLSFSSLAAAKRHFIVMLDRYMNDEQIPEPEAQQLASLLERHPRALEKIGPGILGFKVDLGCHPGNLCFHVVRVDGTTDDFSVAKCLQGDPDPRVRWRKSCRSAIAMEAGAIKERLFIQQSVDGLAPCAVTGERLPFCQLDLDHKHPQTFAHLADQYWQECGRPSDPERCFSPRGSGVLEEAFREDSGLAEGFRVFHRVHSAGHLRLVKAGVNRALGARVGP